MKIEETSLKNQKTDFEPKNKQEETLLKILANSGTEPDPVLVKLKLPNQEN